MIVLEGLDHSVTTPVRTERNVLIDDNEVLFSRSMTEKIGSPRLNLILDRLSECEKVETNICVHMMLIFTSLPQHFILIWVNYTSILLLILLEWCISGKVQTVWSYVQHIHVKVLLPHFWLLFLLIEGKIFFVWHRKYLVFIYKHHNFVKTVDLNLVVPLSCPWLWKINLMIWSKLVSLSHPIVLDYFK